MMLPFALIPVLHVCADRALMGKFFSHPALSVFGGAIATAVTAINGYLLYDLLASGLSLGVLSAVYSVVLVAYYALVCYFAVGPDRWPDLLTRGCSLAKQGVAWVAANTRKVDMLEVHC